MAPHQQVDFSYLPATKCDREAFIKPGALNPQLVEMMILIDGIQEKDVTFVFGPTASRDTRLHHCPDRLPKCKRGLEALLTPAA